MTATQDHLWLVYAIVGLVVIGEALGFLVRLLRLLTIVVDWMDQR